MPKSFRSKYDDPMEDFGKFFGFWYGVVVKNFPNAQIKYKNESAFMKFLGALMFFNRYFMRQYTTVIGQTVYFPYRSWLEKNYYSAGKIVAHEFVHMHEVNPILYLFPQILGIFSLVSLLAFVNLWFLTALSFLLFLIPWPAYWRTRYELNGYAMNLFILGLHLPQYDYRKDAGAIAEQFVDSNYYYMSWNKTKVIKGLIDRYEKLPNTHKAFKEVHEWFKMHRFP